MICLGYKNIWGLLLLLSSCNFEYKENETNHIPKVNKVDQKEKHFFDFDQIIQYKLSIDNLGIMKLPEINPVNEIYIKEKMVKYFLLYGISDTLKIKELEESGFKRKIINKKKNNYINEIFRELIISEYPSNSCRPFFRDILIFKKRDKTIGIANLCFQCNKHIIIGAEANTFGFAQSKDFSSLEILLNYEK